MHIVDEVYFRKKSRTVKSVNKPVVYSHAYTPYQWMDRWSENGEIQN